MLSRHESPSLLKARNLIWNEIKPFFNKYSFPAFDPSILNQSPTEQEAYFSQIYLRVNQLNNFLSNWLIRLDQLVSKLKLQETLPELELIDQVAQNLAEAFQSFADADSRLNKENLKTLLQALRRINTLLPEAMAQIHQKDCTHYNLLAQEVQTIKDILATSIHDVNNEVLQHILTFLNPHETQALRPVSTRFKKLIPLPTPLDTDLRSNKDNLKELIQTYFPESADSDFIKDYKNNYGHLPRRVIELFLKLKKGDVQGIQDELTPADLHYRDKWGNTLMDVACVNNQQTLLDYIYDKLILPTCNQQQDAETKDEHFYNYAQMFFTGINTKVSNTDDIYPEADIINKVNQSREFLLFWAIKCRKPIEVFEPYITPAYIDEVEPHGYTALHVAAASHYPEAVKYFLDVQMMDVNTGTRDAWTALNIAAQKGDTLTVKLLLEVPNVEIYEQDNDYNGTALFLAAKNNDLAVLEQLLAVAKRATPTLKNLIGDLLEDPEDDLEDDLEDGPIDDVNIDDDDGMSPLAIAALMGHTQIVKRLLQVENIKVQLCNGKDGELTPAINNAIKNGHFEIAELLCKMPGININARDSNGDAALHVARSLPMVQLLASLPNRNINIKDEEEGMTPLHLAALNLNLDIVQFLLTLPDVDITAQNLNGDTALHLALGQYKVESNTIPVLIALLQTGKFDINAQDIDGDTVLHLAAQKNDSSVVEFLLKLPNININAKNFEGFTALHAAVTSGKIDMVRALLKNSDIDININDNEEGLTPLHIAVLNDELDMVEFLLSLPHVDMTARDLNGNTALHLALGKGHKIKSNTIPFLKALLQTGEFDIHAQNKDGDTVLHLAALKKDSSVVEFLITQPDLNINAKNLKGHTALHLAVRAGQIDTVRALLKTPGIDIHAADENHKTIISFAIESKDKMMLQYIIEQFPRETLLYESIKHGYIEFVQDLLNHGTDHNLLCFCNSDTMIHQISNYQHRITISQILRQRYGGIPDISEVSLLDLAVFYGHAKIVELLVGYSATIPQEHLEKALQYAQELGKNDIATTIQSHIPSCEGQELHSPRVKMPATSLSKRKRTNAEDDKQQNNAQKEKTGESAPKSQRTQYTLFGPQGKKANTPSTNHTHQP